MIKPDMIPDEVVEAAARAMCRIEQGDELVWELFIAAAEASIAAALSAWPGVTTTSWFENSVRKAVLNIPLPQKEKGGQ